AAITIYFRTDASTSQTPFIYSLTDKFFILCYSIIAYFIRLVFPYNLSAVYSYPEKTNGTLSFEFYAAALILIILVAAVIRLKNKEIRFGALFFLTGIIVSQAGFLEDGFAANRYAYLPYTGLFFIIGNLYSALKKKITYLICISAFLILSAWLSYNRSSVWKDNITLFNDIIDKQQGNAFAYNLRGIAKYNAKDYSGSVEDYSQAIDVNKKYPGAFYNRAISNYAMGNFSKSSDDYTKAIELNPNSAKSYLGRGIIKMDVLKDYDAATRDYNKALELNPYFPQAYYNRGLVKLRTEKIMEACEDFRKVKQLGYPQADELMRRYCN
ncbi:MAG TPA: tetratricopeptide repeat protein, partial [Bacteroidia bacterium]|nr:tetratricopeptide repeat protein [Bacteroidia bacterium]